MQNTLLGLAIAIILALMTALVGPLLIDWGSHRALFEAEARRLTGADVRIAGEIDVRLLPTPQLTLNEIELGGGTIRARSLSIEFALGPLMRGQWRASELHLVGPQVGLSLDANGRVRTPNVAAAFDPDGVTIERLRIADGKIVLADATSGASVTLEQLSFNGEARSLLGPFKGEGAVAVDGELYPYRMSTGRYGDDGTFKLRLNVDPAHYPLSIETDGAVALDDGMPKFDGTLSLARPVGIVSRGAAQAPRTISQPWRISGKLKANAQGALIEQVDFQYGSEERGLNLTGVADFKFGKTPRFDGVLSGRQIDLDRAVAARTGDRPLAATVIRELAELGGGAFRPSIPIQVGIGIDQITLGGNTVQNLRGDISSDANGWNLDRFEFRAPGLTQVRLSGHLAVGRDGVAFTGPAEISAGDPKILAAWLSGGDVAQGDLRPLSLRGEVTLSSEKIAIDRLAAEFDHRPIAGSLIYVFAAEKRSAKLEATLDAPELDLDAALAFGNALLAGSKIEKPHSVSIVADIGRATLAGFVARNSNVRLKVDGNGLQIDKLAIADLGGASFSASGRIVGTAPAPQGSLRLDLDASDMTPVMALLARFAPEVAEVVGSVATTMVPAKLRARLTIDGAAQATQAKLAVDGSLGNVRLALNGQAGADPIALSVGDMRLDARLDADHGKALIAMLGLDRLVTVDSAPGAVSVKADVPAHGDLHVDGWLTAGGLEANLSGSARPFADAASAALRVTIVKADMAPLRGPGDSRAALPVALTTRVTFSGGNLSLGDINAVVAGSAVRGRLDYALTRPHQLRGEIDADQIDAAALVAAAIGMPTSSVNNAAVAWSSEPFADGIFGDFTGQIALKARRLELLPQLSAKEFRASLRLSKDGFAFDDMAGNVAGGRLTGQTLFRRTDGGLTARAKISIVGSDAAGMIVSDTRSPVIGTLDLLAEIEGTGLSPIALIGSLQGSAKISLADGQFASLDPRVFDIVIRAVDQGLPIDVVRIANVTSKALDGGALLIKHMDGTIAINAGQARLNNVTADAKGAALSLSGNLDLTDGSIDARMVLSGSDLAAGARPDIFMALKGPVAAPSRSIDVAALAGWLTLRAVENQARQLREIERAPRQPVDRPPPKHEQAPPLPPPVDIRPAPAPMRSSVPAASVSPQN